MQEPSRLPVLKEDRAPRADPDTQNSPDKAASSSRMAVEETTVQHTSPVVIMPSPVVFDLTDEMTGSHDVTQHYDVSQLP